MIYVISFAIHLTVLYFSFNLYRLAFINTQVTITSQRHLFSVSDIGMTLVTLQSYPVTPVLINLLNAFATRSVAWHAKSFQILDGVYSVPFSEVYYLSYSDTCSHLNCDLFSHLWLCSFGQPMVSNYYIIWTPSTCFILHADWTCP